MDWFRGLIELVWFGSLLEEMVWFGSLLKGMVWFKGLMELVLCMDRIGLVWYFVEGNSLV